MARISFCLFLLIACSANVFGQAGRSAYSSFGIGEQYSNATAGQQGMGGVGVATPQVRFINNINPALLSFNSSTGLSTFQAGILGEQTTIRNESARSKSTGGNLNYMLIGVPVIKGKWASSIGLMPYSGANYRFRYEEPVQGSDKTVVFTESGSGSINQVAWSHGFQITPNISLGARASYLYSSIEHKSSNTVVLDTATTGFTPSVGERYYYRGFALTGGVSFSFVLDSTSMRMLTFGAVYDLKTKLNTEYLQTLVKPGVTSGGDVDTLGTIDNGRSTLPAVAQFGISYGKLNQWVVAVDARFTNYDQMSLFKRETPGAKKGWRVAAGFELTPSINSSNYLKAITYRVGVGMEEYPYMINNKALRDLGTTFGLSFPVAQFCSVDLSGRWGNRGNISDNTVTEQYMKVFFGVTFNDVWFRKRRFD